MAAGRAAAAAEADCKRLASDAFGIFGGDGSTRASGAALSGAVGVTGAAGAAGCGAACVTRAMAAALRRCWLDFALLEPAAGGVDGLARRSRRFRRCWLDSRCWSAAASGGVDRTCIAGVAVSGAVGWISRCWSSRVRCCWLDSRCWSHRLRRCRRHLRGDCWRRPIRLSRLHRCRLHRGTGFQNGRRRTSGGGFFVRGRGSIALEDVNDVAFTVAEGANIDRVDEAETNQSRIGFRPRP